jgi:hypothetical protein
LLKVWENFLLWAGVDCRCPSHTWYKKIKGAYLYSTWIIQKECSPSSYIIRYLDCIEFRDTSCFKDLHCSEGDTQLDLSSGNDSEKHKFSGIDNEEDYASPTISVYLPSESEYQILHFPSST